MSMDSKMVGFMQFDTGAGSVTPNRAYNCTIVRTADGDYNITLGQGGVDGALCDVSAVATSGAAAGAGTARVVNVTHTSDTVKRVQIRDDAGAFALASVNISFRKFPPLPAP